MLRRIGGADAFEFRQQIRCAAHAAAIGVEIGVLPGDDIAALGTFGQAQGALDLIGRGDHFIGVLGQIAFLDNARCEIDNLVDIQPDQRKTAGNDQKDAGP